MAQWAISEQYGYDGDKCPPWLGKKPKKSKAHQYQQQIKSTQIEKAQKPPSSRVKPFVVTANKVKDSHENVDYDEEFFCEPTKYAFGHSDKGLNGFSNIKMQ